ncbi:MAG: GTPase [Thermodesulfobacteriota bacterium]
MKRDDDHQMTDRSSIARSLERARDFLMNDGAFFLSEAERESNLEELRVLLEKAYEPGEALYVGILGGTGVGKSMLINALAGKTISGFSDRRPFTDRAVVYRHKERDRGLEKVAQFIREPDAVHEIEAVKNLVLLDMPDFDSIEEENRDAVLSILPELDAIVWVVSPEKYADAAFYDLVRSTHRHQDSFTFVFNKADQLIEKGRPDEHARLKEVLGDLTFRLKHEAGVEQPRLFSLSAEQEFTGMQDEPALAREFQRFRDFLMARRNAKEIMSIKTVNLEMESRAVLQRVDSAIRPQEKTRALEALETVCSEPSVEMTDGADILEREKDLSAAIMHYFVRSEASVAAVTWFLKVLVPRRWAGLTASELTVKEALARASEGLTANKKDYAEKVAARARSELLFAFSPGDGQSDGISPSSAIDLAAKEAEALVLQTVRNRSATVNGSAAKWRRGVQKAVLFLPIPILVMKLAGVSRIESWVNNPTAGGLLNIVISVLSSLFSSEGLVGLLVLGICQLFLAYWLAVRRVRTIEREAEKIARWATEHLEKSLAGAVRQIRGDAQSRVLRIRQGLDRWNELTSSLGRGHPSTLLP